MLTPVAYYNENDPGAAAWLRELIRRQLIAPGDVDERSIEDVRPSDLIGYRQHHFFAGIGGWSLALRVAGWPDDLPVWTGSCPCQPFSQAGKGVGFADERHLWPAFHWLIRHRRPGVVFGEQVASALDWLDLVFDDLEGEGYSCRANDLCAAGVGAPHIRQRLYWVAHADDEGSQRRRVVALERATECVAGTGGVADRMGDPDSRGPSPRHEASAREGHGGTTIADGRGSDAGPLHSFWRDADWILCRDGKWRPVEPGTQPLADGVPARVVRLRGYGNAIVPQVAVEFIQSFLRDALALDAGKVAA